MSMNDKNYMRHWKDDSTDVLINRAGVAELVDAGDSKSPAP
jgi:hypothetical protein